MLPNLLLPQGSLGSSLPLASTSLLVPSFSNCHHHHHHHHHNQSPVTTSQLQWQWLSKSNKNSNSLVCGFSQDGRNPISQDSDKELDEDELDALFEQHGEVVVPDRNPHPVSAEVDDDVQSLALAVALAEAANDTKAVDIVVLHVKPLVYWTRFFVIATAFSRPQLSAINKRMRDIGEERFNILPRGDTKPNSWTLLDYGDVVVHVFLPKERSFYNLEEFYGNAGRVELPFKSTPASSLG